MCTAQRAGVQQQLEALYAAHQVCWLRSQTLPHFDVVQELQEALEAAQEDAAAAQESVEEEQRAHLNFVMRVREHHRLETATVRKRCGELVEHYKVRKHLDERVVPPVLGQDKVTRMTHKLGLEQEKYEQLSARCQEQDRLLGLM